MFGNHQRGRGPVVESHAQGGGVQACCWLPRDTPSGLSGDRVTCGFVVDRLVARRRVRAEGYPLADVDTATSQDWGVHAEQHCL